MNEMADLLRGALAGGSLFALPLVLAGGVVTGLNPCCLSLYPAAAATCCATRDERLSRTFATAVAFAVGIALATTALGVLAAFAGRTLTSLGGWSRYLIAGVPLVMGAQLLGWIRLPIGVSERKILRRGVVPSFLTGLLLSLVLIPCGTPLLAAVLSYAAYRGSVPYGGMLLFLYGIGTGVPILLVATTAGGFAARFDGTAWQRWIESTAGMLLLALGLYILWVS